MQEPVIVIFDLETIPNLKEAMKVWPQISNYPGLTLKATISTIICAGYKYLSHERINCINAWDFDEWAHDINDDYKVVKAIYDVISKADAVVTQNGKRFDWPFLQTRIMYHKLPPLPGINHIDTKQLAKRNLFAFNNRLDTLGELLAGEKKLENGGWDLWVKVSERDPEAMQLMEDYCKQDVALLEKVFLRLRPFAKNIPNFNLFMVEERVCPSCGGCNLRSNGIRATQTRTYRRLQCLDCGSWSRTDLRDENPRSI